MGSDDADAGEKVANGGDGTDQHREATDATALVSPPTIVIDAPSSDSPHHNNDDPAVAESGDGISREQQKAAVKLDDFVYLGRYALLVCCLSELMILFQIGNMLYMVYAGAGAALIGCGATEFHEGMDAKARCAFITGHQNGSSACEPNFRAQFESVNYEFGYYCDSAKLVKQSISVQMIGVMVGSIIFGHLSDAYGRRKIMMIALLLCIVSMMATSFTNDLFWFTFWRFFVNAFNGGTLVILMVLVVENLPKKDRFWISNIITWSPNFVVFAIIAYLCGDWRTLTRASAVLALPAVGLLWFLCESPRFLVQSRRLDAARAAIVRIHRIDGRTLDEPLLDHVLAREEQLFLESKKKKQKYNFVHLFYTWTFTRYTVAVAFSLLVTSIMNYSLLYNLEKVSGSIYWNSIYLGLFRYSCNLAIAFMDIRFKWLGRKTVHYIADAFAALALAIPVLIHVFGLDATLALLGRAAVLSVIGICSLLYTTNGIVSNELFPTPVRNLSYSFGQLFSRVGVVIAPQLFFLSDVWTPLPFATMFALAVADLLLFQFNVIETKGKPLSEHMPSKEQRLFYRGNKSVELLPKSSATFIIKDDPDTNGPPLEKMQ